MEFKYFKLIKTIAEEGSISNSADRLFLTQSALSHQLRDLESRLGFRVFIRSRNKWKLTEEGAELYLLAKKVLKDIDEGLDRIQNVKAGSKGKIRISTECYSFYRGLPSFVQKTGLLYPEIELELVIEATHKPIEKILENELDLAIITSKKNDDRLAYIDLFEDEVFMLVHEENLLNMKKSISPDDFRSVHLIIHSFPLETVSIHQIYLKRHQIDPLKISAIPLTEVSLEMVKANMGVMCLPKWALKSFQIPKEISYKKIGDKGLKRTHSLVVRKSDLHKKYIKDFMLNVEEEFMSHNYQEA